MEVLVCLAESAGNVVSKEQLIKAVWAETFVGDDVLTRCISELRKAFDDDAKAPRIIETIPKRGYRLLEMVEPIIPSSPSWTDRIVSWIDRVHKARLAMGVVAMLALAAGVYWWVESGRKVQANRRVTIAVLPFQNAGSDQDSNFLRFALPDEVVNSMSYSGSLSIRPSTMTKRYPGPDLDLPRIGAELHVSDLVTGHYLSEKDRLEVTLEAVEVKNNQIVWQEILRVGAHDLIEMRDQITTRTRLGLIPALGVLASAYTGTRPQNEEAYSLYLRSIAAPHDAPPNREAIDMLERSVGIDSNFARAWEALGLRYRYDAAYSNGGKEMLQRSNHAYERALALDPNLMLAAGQLITNRVERGEPGKAYEEAQTLAERHPESAQAHFVLGYVLRYAGALEQSTKECDKALELDPWNYTLRSCAWAFMEQGKIPRALDFLRLDAGSDWSAYGRATALLDEGKPAEAREVLQGISSNPNHFRDFLLACLQSPPAPELDGIAREVESGVGGTGDPEAIYYQGAILAYCGQKEHAIHVLKLAIHANYCSYEALQSDPLLVNLRATPEFSQLLSAGKECQRRFLAHEN